MRQQALPNDLLHNPFFNRFNDPVTYRRDELQSYENVVSTHCNQAEAQAVIWSTMDDKDITDDWRASQFSRVASVFAEAFALLVVLLVSASILKTF